MDRGSIGTMPLGAERDDDAYIDFVEGVRVFDIRRVSPVMQQRGAEAAVEYERRTGRAVADEAAMREALAGVPIIATRSRIWRSTQEMLWEQVAATYRKREDELLAELDEAEHRGPGAIELNPQLALPDYYARVEFHIQPGSYYADPLAGYIYHYGTKAVFAGTNDLDQVQIDLANACPTPDDGQVRRVLDLACSIGQSTTALKQRFPRAEVWGIDAAAPMVRYTHKRAVDLGIEIRASQRLAERTGFADASFDLVYTYLLFHETPVEATRAIVAEACRLLRPGGLFVVVDSANRPFGHGSIVREYVRHFVSRDNGEPYEIDWMRCDFPAILRGAGFTMLSEDFLGAPGKPSPLPMRVARR